MPTPTIYYMRHGETAWNAEGRLQGTLDIPLTDRGRAQASHAGHVLADLLKRDGRDKASLPFVASPLGRARSTMELVRHVLEFRRRLCAHDRVGRSDMASGTEA
jgi:probable phosphoglycerate mutase